MSVESMYMKPCRSSLADMRAIEEGWLFELREVISVSAMAVAYRTDSQLLPVHQKRRQNLSSISTLCVPIISNSFPSSKPVDEPIAPV